MASRPGPRPTLLVAVMVAVLTSVIGVAGSRASTGPLLAWGSNADGQLGPGSSDASSARPVGVDGVDWEVSAVAAGVGHSLALRASDGSVWAWGRNGENELGDGVSMYMPRPGPLPRPDPAPVSGLSGVSAIAAGWYHSLAVKEADGTVWAWGENNCGQHGSGKLPFGTPQNALSPPTPVKVAGLPAKVVAVAAGRGHSLALDVHGVLWAWGENRWGQLGIGHGGTRSTSADCPMPSKPDGRDPQIVPVKVALGSRVLAFAAGSDHSLALTEDGTVWSWGNNCAGQLGPVAGAAPRSSQSTPLPVTGLPTSEVVALAAGGSAGGGHSLALDRSGQVWAWGLADVLGRGEPPGAGDASPCSQDPLFPTEVVKPGAGTEDFPNQKVRITPQRVKDTEHPTGYLSDVVSLAAGTFHSIAIQADGTVLAWGRNPAGELGPLPSPGATAGTAVKSLDRSVEGPVARVAARSHTLAVRGTPPPRPAFTFPADDVPADPGGIVPDDPGGLVPDDPTGLVPEDPGDGLVPEEPGDGVVPESPGDVADDDPAGLAGDRERPLSGSGGGVFVSGIGQESNCPDDCNAAGARHFLKRAVAYVTPGDDAPRVLLVPTNGWSIRAMQMAEFDRCGEVAAPAAPGCFDVAYNTDVYHPDSDDEESPDQLRRFPPDANLKDVRFDHYEAVVVGSGRFADMDVLVERANELYSYVNRGGGLVAFVGCCHQPAHDHAEPPYDGGPENGSDLRELRLDFLPFLRSQHMGDMLFTVTPEGRDLGLTEGDVNGRWTQRFFVEPCGFDPLVRAAANGRIVTMGTHKPIPTPCTGVQVRDVSVKEGDGGVTPATFAVSLAQARDVGVRIDYTTIPAGSTAGDVCPESQTGGADYLSTSGTLNFPAGETGPLTVTVPVCGDRLSESDEILLLRLTSPDDAGLEMTATGTIVNDDGDPPGDEPETGTTPGGGDRGENASQAPVRPAQPVQVPAPAPVAAPAPAAAAAPAVALAPAVAPAPAPAQATSQAQAQQGSRAEVQQGAQASSQAGSPAEAQADSAAQATAASPQVGMATDEQRQSQAERAKIDGGPDELLASERRPDPTGPLALFGTAAALAIGLGGIRRRPAPQRHSEAVPSDTPPPTNDRRLSLRRARGQR